MYTPLQIENRETRWDAVISSLNGSKGNFIVTSDTKRLLRLGIPISQRVSNVKNKDKIPIHDHITQTDSLISWKIPHPQSHKILMVVIE